MATRNKYRSMTVLESFVFVDIKDKSGINVVGMSEGRQVHICNLNVSSSVRKKEGETTLPVERRMSIDVGRQGIQ